MKKLYVPLLALVIFLVPSNLFLKFFESSAYVNGLFVDYLVPKLYLSDIPIFGLLGLWGIEYFRYPIKNFHFSQQKSLKFILLATLMASLLLRQVFTAHPLAAWWYAFKLIESVLLGAFIVTHRSLWTDIRIHFALALTVIFQSTLALYQYATQSPLFGYWFLGETNLSNPLGLATIVIDGVEKVLPYGTTAHPNILAGVLVIYGLILSRLTKDSRLLIPTVVLGGIVLFLTYSVSAWLSLLIALVLLVTQPWSIEVTRWSLLAALITLALTPLILHQFALIKPESLSLTRRDYLNEAAWNMVIDHPFVGVGLNNFTANVEQYSPSREVVRFVQPVHHVWLLWLAETGLLGLGLLTLLVRQFKMKLTVWWLILLPLGALDHYLLSNQSGLLLLTFIVTIPSE